jgi:hypothetical protein
LLLKFSKAGRIWSVTQEKHGLVQILFAFFLFSATAGWLVAGENPKHTGTKLDGYATGVTPESITVFDKQGQERKILTDKDYTSIVGLGAEVTVWYKNEGGVYHLEDIQWPNEGFFLPANRIRENIKRIIILPRSEDVENTQGLFAAISRYLQENAGWFVAPPELGEEIANRAENNPSSLDAIDPKTGQIDVQQFLEAQGFLVTRIAQETRVDAVLAIKVVKVKAHVRGSVASWDDMTEAVASNRTRALSKLTIEGGRGWVYAATVDMNLWSRSGKLLWKKRRGFAALGFQMGMGSTYRARPLTEVYENREALETWLATTLGELAPRATYTAPGQVSPELRKQLEKAKSTAQER